MMVKDVEILGNEICLMSFLFYLSIILLKIYSVCIYFFEVLEDFFECDKRYLFLGLFKFLEYEDFYKID